MGATYSYSLTPDHYLAAMTLGTRQLYADPAVRRANRAYALTYMLAWFALWLAAMAPLEPAQGLGLLALVVGGLALTVFLARRSQQAAFRAVADGVLASGGEFTLEQDDDGLVFGHAQGTSRIAWSGVRGVLEGPGLLVIQLRNFSVLPVPHGAFPDAASRQAFQALVKQEVERSGGETKVAPVVAPRSLDSGEAAMTGAAEGPLHRELGAHLRRGLRLLFLLSPGEPAPRESWTFFILLALLSLAVPPLFALAQTGFQGEFQAYQLPTAVFHLPVFALAAWVLAALAGRVERTLDLLLALVAMAVPLDGLVGLAYAVYPEGWDAGGDWVYQAPHLWLALAATVAAARLLGLDAGRRLAALGLALGTVSLPLGAVYRDRALWEAPESRAEQAENERRWNALVNEDSFYRQPRLLDQALAGLQPGRPGMTELFFVGLAGDAGQDVFMKEVRVVADLFRERFGTEGHTLTLINNPDSVADSPIATATSLERALARVGQAMNREEDILFLYLSSHGDEDHRLALEFWPLRTKPLHPANLRAMLDRAGIQRRVVVVSACYSGGFIDALKDEHTLVITAAAPDRQSFGCDDQADFTYFGQAYFHEALRQTRSFTEAFHLAKTRIAERERQEGETPSEPRLFLAACRT